MEDLKKNFIDYQSKKLQVELNEVVDLLCDLTIEPDLLDILHLLEIVIQIRNLKKFIKKGEY